MKREIENTLIDMIQNNYSNFVIIIEGARQVGKSYLVNNVLKSLKTPYLSFDLEKNKKLRFLIDKTKDFEDFSTLMKDQFGLKDNSILFIDEAQESKKLANYIKEFKEDWKKIQVILTGSSMNHFFNKDIRIPVGRTKSITVFGFSFSEFVKYIKGENLFNFLNSAPSDIPLSRHNLLLNIYDQYMQVGGYPEAVKAYKNNKLYYEIIDEIISGLEDDFQRKELEDTHLFSDIIQGIANFVGSISKLTYFNTSKYKAKKIIEAMKGWHIVLEIEQYSLDPLRSKFLPKRYLHDIGVTNRKRSLAIPSISILDTIEPNLRSPLGGLFENAFLINLLCGKPVKYKVGSWKKGGNTDIEVDFIMDAPEFNIKIPIECKAAKKIKKKHYKNILYYLKITNQKFGIIISAAPFEKIIIDTIFILNLPIYLASRENIIQYYKYFIK